MNNSIITVKEAINYEINTVCVAAPNTGAHAAGAHAAGAHAAPQKHTLPKIVPKIWGYEIIFANNELYCGKILHFYEGGKGSLHYHVKKTESWYIQSGRILLVWVNGTTGEFFSEIMSAGDTVSHKSGECHCVEALEETDIFEVSTTHYDDDSYRIFVAPAVATHAAAAAAPPAATYKMIDDII
jgi:mannose-6-phosphate isomerase-like protein (cupin superfamily)